MSNDNKPAKAVADLEPFLGTWRNTGTLYDETGKEAGRMNAIDHYEWLEGGFFMLHRIEGRLGHNNIRVLEVIGVQRKGGDVIARFYDNRGMTGEQTNILDGKSFSVDGPQQRFRGQFDDDFQTLEGLWEMADDGKTWRPWMKIVLEKQAPAMARAPRKAAARPVAETRH